MKDSSPVAVAVGFPYRIDERENVIRVRLDGDDAGSGASRHRQSVFCEMRGEVVPVRDLHHSDAVAGNNGMMIRNVEIARAENRRDGVWSNVDPYLDAAQTGRRAYVAIEEEVFAGAAFSEKGHRRSN